jgi:hypothetical protein
MGFIPTLIQVAIIASIGLSGCASSASSGAGGGPGAGTVGKGLATVAGVAFGASVWHRLRRHGKARAAAPTSVADADADPPLAAINAPLETIDWEGTTATVFGISSATGGEGDPNAIPDGLGSFPYATEADYRSKSTPQAAAPGEVIADDESARWLSVRVTDSDGHRLATFSAGAENTLRVRVGPSHDDWMIAEGAPPVDRQLPPDAFDQGDLPLFVLVQVPDLSVRKMAEIRLPPIGPSSVAIFPLHLPASLDHLVVDISLLDRNRVLQRLTISGLCLSDSNTTRASRFTLTFAGIRPGLNDLANRTRFDAAFIVEADDDEMGTTVVRDDELIRCENMNLGNAEYAISEVLAQISSEGWRSEGFDTPQMAELFRGLAFQGRLLSESLGRRVMELLGNSEATRLQVVVTNPNAFLPLEFIYDLASPSELSSLCPNWRSALANGRCDDQHHLVNELGQMTVICPSGFWGISKVIERHVEVPRPTPHDAEVTQSETSTARRSLRPVTNALFGASSKVKPVPRQQIIEGLEMATGAPSEPVRSWQEWVHLIRQRDPELLVLLSHTTKVEGTIALEIEGDQRLVLAQINTRYVRSRDDLTPVVLLIGCNTGVLDHTQIQSFVTRFRLVGASIVVGTLIPIRSSRAAVVATTIIAGLVKGGADDNSEDWRFGDLMTALRRELLARGEPSGLALTFFGDSDWTLPRGGEHGLPN